MCGNKGRRERERADLVGVGDSTTADSLPRELYHRGTGRGVSTDVHSDRGGGGKARGKSVKTYKVLHNTLLISSAIIIAVAEL